MRKSNLIRNKEKKATTNTYNNPTQSIDFERTLSK
jgi:hypothetical protein